MNYIHALRNDLAAKDKIIAEFRTHLAGSKFQGLDLEGARKDWIAVADVLAWLERIISVDVSDAALRLPMEDNSP